MRAIMMAVVLATAAGPTWAAAEKPIQMSPALDTLLTGKTAGKPLSCISLPRVRSSTTLRDPDTLIYRMSSRLTYVNQPVGGCGFRGDEIIASRTPSTQLCAGDIIVGIDRGSRIPSASCGLGQFVPYSSGK